MTNHSATAPLPSPSSGADSAAPMSPAMARHKGVMQRVAQRAAEERSPAKLREEALRRERATAAEAIWSICGLPVEQAKAMLRAGFSSGLDLEAAPTIAASRDRVDVLEALLSMGLSPLAEPHPFFRKNSVSALAATPLMAAAQAGNVSAALWLQERGADPFADARPRRTETPSLPPEPLRADIRVPLGSAPVEAAVLHGHASLALDLLFARRSAGPFAQEGLDRLAGSVALACKPLWDIPGDDSRVSRSDIAELSTQMALCNAFLGSANVALAPGDLTHMHGLQCWILDWADTRFGSPQPRALPTYGNTSNVPGAVPASILALACKMAPELRDLAQSLTRGLDAAAFDRATPDGIGHLASLALFASRFKKQTHLIGADLLAAGALIHAPDEKRWVCPWLCSFLALAGRAQNASSRQAETGFLSSLAEQISKTAAAGGKAIPRESHLTASLALAQELFHVGQRAANSGNRNPPSLASGQAFDVAIRLLARETDGTSLGFAWSSLLQTAPIKREAVDTASLAAWRDGEWLSQVESIVEAAQMELALLRSEPRGSLPTGQSSDPLAAQAEAVSRAARRL